MFYQLHFFKKMFYYSNLLKDLVFWTDTEGKNTLENMKGSIYFWT